MNLRRYKNPIDPPRWIWIPAILALLFISAPIITLLLRSPWSVLWTEIQSEEIREAIRLSIVCSTAAAVISIILGFPLAWVFARVEFKGKQWLRSAILLPAVLPPVVSGVALLLLFGRTGPIGAPLDRAFGITIPFTTFSAVVAELYIALPFFILSAEAGIRGLDPRFEEAAATLGAGAWARFVKIILPSIRAPLFAGAALAWARALGEFGATITFAGSFPGRTQTMPLAVLLALENRPDGALALSIVMIALALAIFVLLRKSVRFF